MERADQRFQRVDITGQRFGRLIAVSRVVIRTKTYWNCQCDCGKTTCVRLNLLRRGFTKSCGCLRSEFITKINKSRKKPDKKKDKKIYTPKPKRDFTGRTFYCLTAIHKVSDGGKHKWRFSCDCGKEKDILIDSVLNGNTKSCGCLRKRIGSGEIVRTWEVAERCRAKQ